MNNLLQIFLIGCALLFSGIVITLLLQNKIGERNSVIWLGGSILVLIISGNPSWFDKLARLLGIDYPPALLFLLSNLVLLIFILYLTIQITRLSNKVKDITQYLALKTEENEQLKKDSFQVENEHERNFHA